MGYKVSEVYRLPQKRTMVEIRAHAQWKRVQHDSIKDDLLQIETEDDLDRYITKELTPEYMSLLGNVQFLIEEYVAARRSDIQKENPNGIQSLRSLPVKL